MILHHNGFDFELKAYNRTSKDIVDISINKKNETTLSYLLKVDEPTKCSIVIEVKLLNEENLFHLIPCNIHGDNNLINAKPGFFPNLTTKFNEYTTSSTIWEFRADRASHPVSIITCGNGAIGISIDPYSFENGKIVKNGLFSKLPNSAGVTIGYKNIPYTFTSKENLTTSTSNTLKNITMQGEIYLFRGKKRLSSHDIIKAVYSHYHNQPKYHHTIKEYLEGFLNSYKNINWSNKFNAFTNMDCKLPTQPKLKPWRPLIEIGWTGTGVLSYPLLMSQFLLNISNTFTNTLIETFDAMQTRINPKSGLFYDLVKTNKESDVNGWWAGYIVKDCHCAYTNGNGIYYLLRTYMFLKKHNNIIKTEWLQSGLTALNAIIELQKEDGNFGYTYSINKKEIIDDSGFAGCWFVPSLALAYQITKNQIYLDSAIKGIAFYNKYVEDLNCYGTPMDTYKSIDQEGNLAFIKGARLLHEITKNELYLTMLKNGANYEYLWRYSYKAYPDYKPLKDSFWNSCGGSVTSVSNPHIHPMGVNITADLFYLHNITKDSYHLNRALDGLYWGLQTADLYPEITGYGQLGVMTERYCPSDGLTIEHYDNGDISSIWFTFNGWAGASVLEGLCESIIQHYIDI